jgi:hypothetical protein
MKQKLPIQVWDKKTQAFVTRVVLIEVDMLAIATTLGRKACANKSGRSIGLGGCVTVKAIA